MCKLSQNVSIEELKNIFRFEIEWTTTSLTTEKSNKLFFYNQINKFVVCFHLYSQHFFPLSQCFSFLMATKAVNEPSWSWITLTRPDKKLVYVYLFINKPSLSLSFSLFNKQAEPKKKKIVHKQAHELLSLIRNNSSIDSFISFMY